MKYINEMLEFNEIINRLKNYCITEKAKENFEILKPILSEGELRIRMKETSEARMLLDAQGAPPLGTVSKIREIVEGAERGELLSIDELEKISQFAILCTRVIKYLNKSNDRNLKISEYG
ncbi:MAG: mismatch repair protein MutS domain protein, partial [Anaerocolumna sp.]|nr:mismatch repair protein MutS domain protein [Anaerocolumna sp.]